MEIRDPRSSELLSTLTKPGARFIGGLTYSPDGRSLACLSGTALIIWDIQTGGVAKDIGHSGATGDISLVWSLDGEAVGIFEGRVIRTVRVYDIASGATRSPGTLRSSGESHLWVHNATFRVMTTRWDGQAFTIDVFEVGSTLIEIQSFRIRLLGKYPRIECFSPTTSRVSISVDGHFVIMDIRKSERLLERKQFFDSHCFSSDGSLFAASLPSTDIHIWKYASGRYTPWREFQTVDWVPFYSSPLQFSPTSSSILGSSRGNLQVWRLDGPPVIAHPDSRTPPLAVLSQCGTYVATFHANKSTITVVNSLSQTPPHFIDTDMMIDRLAFTGNILLVVDSQEIVAWRLTEEGVVDGVCGRRAGRGDSIWALQRSGGQPTFMVDDQTVHVKLLGTGGEESGDAHIYHAGTGEVLEHTQASESRRRTYFSLHMQDGQHYFHYHRVDERGTPSKDDWPVSLTTLREGWVTDPEGKCRLWIPTEWRTPSAATWFSNTTTLLLIQPRRLGTTVTIIF